MLPKQLLGDYRGLTSCKWATNSRRGTCRSLTVVGFRLRSAKFGCFRLGSVLLGRILPPRSVYLSAQLSH